MSNISYTLYVNTLLAKNEGGQIINYLSLENTTITEDDDIDDGNELAACRHTSNQCAEGWIVDAAMAYSKDYHVYLALTICCFGTIANLLNIAVLTRKDMVCAPINRILTGMAVADMLIMLEYIPFGYYYYIELPGKMNYPYWGAVYMLVHMHFTQIMHTISICLTLTLAIWRYLAIGYPNNNHTLCSESRCTLGISLSYLLPIVLCFPAYVTFEIRSIIVTEDKDYVLYHVTLSEMASKYNYFVIYMWLYAVVIKLLPCCILTAISWWLIRTLFVAKERKQMLRAYNTTTTTTTATTPSTSTDNVQPSNHLAQRSKVERRAERTTKMLVAVVSLFLLTEFPQGMFGLLIGLKGNCLFLNCYQKFGELMDVLALLNGSINFILYCWMNRMFRITFNQLFNTKVLTKLVPPVSSEVFTTYV